MLRAIAIVAALVTPAFAETTVDVGFGHQERAAIPRGSGALAFGKITKGTHLDAVSVDLRGLRATMKLSLSSVSKDGQDAALDFEVPTGTQVTYLGITIGGERRIAYLETAVGAAEKYERIVEGKVDPALIELVGATATTDKLRLRVFPLMRGKPAKVEVIMTLPPSASLRLEPGRHAIARKQFALGQEDATPTVLESVDREHSLFISEPFTDPEELQRAQAAERRVRARFPRGAIKIAKECLDNPLAPSCM